MEPQHPRSCDRSILSAAKDQTFPTTMRPRVVILTVVALCLALTLIWLLRPGRSRGPITPNQDSALRQTSTPRVALNRHSTNAAPPEQTNASGQTNRKPSSDFLPVFDSWKQTIHRPIEFYG